MPRLGRLFSLGLALSLAGLLLRAADQPTAPPATPKKPVTDTYHGIKVTDDYRWLENTKDPAVRKWIEAQNHYARAVLDQSSALPALRKRLKELMSASSPAYFALRKAGGTLFALKSQPPKEQPFLVTLQSVEDPASARVVLDPNVLDNKGKTTIDFYVPSRDGRLVAVSLSEGGSEEGTVHVFDVATGKKLPDVIPRVQFPTGGGDLVWAADNGGFFYTRYPRGNERPKEDRDFYEQIYFHKLGTDTAEDSYVLGKDFPRIAEIFLDDSADGKHLLATVQKGDGGEFEHFLMTPDGKWTRLTHYADQISAAAFGAGDDHALYLLSRKDAPRGQLLRLPLDKPELKNATVFVKESDVAIEGLRIGSNRLYPTFTPTPRGVYVTYVNGGPSEVRFFDRSGKAQPVPLPPVCSVGSIFSGGGDEVLLHVATYLQPAAWYAYKPGEKELRRTALYQTSPADFSNCEVVREFATSRDGTQVPLSILRRKGTKLDGTNPTLLTGYGGFGISQTPRFSSTNSVWLEQGGILAIANLRGGSEYGEAWHKAGNLTKKQNVFDDFAACAKHLIERKYTSPDKLAIEGGSNGGLLMGAALTQHPELFRAVVTHVGLYDMLRFEQHPNGAFNVTEYGSIQDPEQFKALYAYSPYQHVKDGTAYPAVFVLTGANDGRVDPANSLKFAVRLQAATSSKRPILLLVSLDSGHGIGDNLSAAVERKAEVDAFLFEQLGMKYREK
jgi:prolyl oligopeptidase